MSPITETEPTVTRFAPSPTGLLHLGHAYSALFAHRIAAEAGGRFLLRIEDIDAGRCRPEFDAAIREDLAWLGLAWEEPVRHQSEYMADYSAALDRLAAGDLLYPCFCTRKEILAEIERAGGAPQIWAAQTHPIWRPPVWDRVASGTGSFWQQLPVAGSEMSVSHASPHGPTCGPVAATPELPSPSTMPKVSRTRCSVSLF